MSKHRQQNESYVHDRAMMRNPDNWPVWPYLPLKRGDYSLENRNLGILWVGTNGLTVHFCYLFDLPKTAEEFKALPSQTYESVDEILADGWIVD